MAQGTMGRVVQVMGTVVDVEFPPDELPTLLSGLELQLQGQSLILEVEQVVHDIRCLAVHLIAKRIKAGETNIVFPNLRLLLLFS